MLDVRRRELERVWQVTFKIVQLSWCAKYEVRVTGKGVFGVRVEPRIGTVPCDGKERERSRVDVESGSDDGVKTSKM